MLAGGRQTWIGPAGNGISVTDQHDEHDSLLLSGDEGSARWAGRRPPHGHCPVGNSYYCPERSEANSASRLPNRGHRQIATVLPVISKHAPRAIASQLC